MKIVMMPLSEIVPYARNPRINQDAVATVKASIKEFGWQQPIVVDEDNIIVVGHTRYLAAQQLGLNEAPVKYAEGLTPQQIKAYRIMDNKSNEKAAWDYELLNLEFGDLQEMNFNLDLTGFEQNDRLSIGFGDVDHVDSEKESSSKEVDTEEFEMNHRCPRCGFEFDDDQ